ncbi:MAG: UDP-N-acetylmuramate--L-alanine ligase [bacterium]|nr:UDP-N-acetylmuramate--L-alanine ligase [bacterium]
MTLHDAQSIHIIGIGGIGVSAIAKWALEQGKRVSGSDIRANESTTWLSDHGATVHIGEQAAANLPSPCNLVLHTVAVKAANVERVAAAEQGLPTLTYPEALNELLQGKNGIAVAGTHGKSTTTAILATILMEAQRDPTVVVGTKLRLFGNTNEHSGHGNDILIEADEYNQGILLYHPTHAVVLNVDHEHVDVYPTLANAQQAFATFVSHVPARGSVTLNADDPSTAALAKATIAKVLTFGLGQADIVAQGITHDPQGTSFTVSGLYTGAVRSQLFGDHNVYNVLAALCIANTLGIPFTVVQRAVAAFPGTWRRFERRGEWHGAVIIDDYAHHPTEIVATLQAARQAFPGKRLVCVFQPHLHSRTIAFFDDFAKVLRTADQVILLDVYDVAGREDTKKADVRALAKAISPLALFVKDVRSAVSTALKIVKPGDVILTLGAGDITHFAELAQKETPPR